MTNNTIKPTLFATNDSNGDNDSETSTEQVMTLETNLRIPRYLLDVLDAVYVR